MRAVVDTNILIRALIKPGGSVGPILARLVKGDYTLIYSDPLLSELLEKLALPRIRDKYGIDADVTEGFLQLLVLRGEQVTPTRHVKICRDPDDDRVIEAALEGAADFIVSGDDDLIVLSSIEGVPVVSPSEFLRALDKAA
jgi:putative PIN family toxin of toxin-antitoxin system